MEFSDIPLRVRYADTDRMGVVYHGTYSVYCEIGRSEFMRERGFTYRRFEEMGYYLAVSEIQMRYYSSALYDDLLIVRTNITDVQSRGVVFNYLIHRDGVKVVEGRTKHICLNSEKKPVRIPSSLLNVLKHVDLS
jgi:acyl-CoA thioester hydrolase